MENRGDPLIGHVLDGRYRVSERIARGGMAMVYEATDQRLDRVVAVKVMHAGLAEDPEFVRRFEREARTAARLAHPNAVAVFDQGDDSGTLFLVMEYVPGTTLRDLMRTESPMPPARALAILDPVLSALQAAHGIGLIHRDVKPENVLIADDDLDGRHRHDHRPDIKVADFGLARAVNAETQATATGGVLIGTVSYLAPELVVDGSADARVDVYAAGVLLYEMLTGRKPHQADSPIQVAYKHVHEDIPAPSAAVPGIPPYVDALVARATARDPSLRPADAGVLLHQVRRVRQALDQGVLDDPELTDDLAPRDLREHTDELPDLTGPLPQRIIDPSDEQALTAFEAAVPGEESDDLTAPVVRRPAPNANDEDPRLYAEGRPSRRGPLMLLALLIVVGLVALAGWYFGFARYTVTPGVLNLSQTAAQTRLQQAGLKMTVSGDAYSETVAKGFVVSTDPTPGSRVLKHGTVAVVISRGPERHPVPDVREMTLPQAQAALTAAHLSFGQAIARYSESVPKGQVIASDPTMGKEERRDTAIDLIVSKGQRPIKIPSFVGKADALAVKKLSKLGFNVDDSASDYSDTVPQGKVISQTPDSGTGHKGDQITLVISKGPRLITVPDVRRETFADAQAQLAALGLRSKGVQSMFYIGIDRVAAMSPGPGTRVPKGTVITLDLV